MCRRCGAYRRERWRGVLVWFMLTEDKRLVPVMGMAQECEPQERVDDGGAFLGITDPLDVIRKGG